MFDELMHLAVLVEAEDRSADDPCRLAVEMVERRRCNRRAHLGADEVIIVGPPYLP